MYFKGIVPKSPTSLETVDLGPLRPEDIESADHAYELGMKLNDDLAPKRAIAMLRRAIALNPRHSEAICELGSTLHDTGQHLEAVALFEKALEEEPSSAEVRLEFGNNLLRMGKLSQAVDHYRRCLDDRPNWDAPHGQLILALTRLGRPEEAKVILEDLQRFEPDYRTVQMLEKLIASAE